MKTKIYGIKNCSTMKKAFDWLNSHGVDYDFHDYKKAAIDAITLARWCEAVGWEALVNKRGTTWRKLGPEEQEIGGHEEAIALMLAHPSLIKRPVLELGDGRIVVGFDPGTLSSHFASRDRT